MKLKRRYKFILLLLLVVAINALAYLYDYRTAPTERVVYKLDDASIGVLQHVNQPIIITFYRSDNLQPSEQRFADNVKLVLEAYKKQAKVPIHIEYINPNESLEVRLEATNSGIKPIDVESSNNTLRNIFLGMIVQVGDKVEVLPQIMPRMSIEYLVSSSLRKLMEKRRRKIAVIQGHDEPFGEKISGIARKLLPNYDLDSVVLRSETNILDYESLLIIAPSFKYNDAELDKMDTFLNAGKNIFIALDRVEYDLKDEEGYAISTRLDEWLLRKGLILQKDFIVDNSCIGVRAEGYNTDIAFPYFPKITNFPPHVATEGVAGITLRFASSVESLNKEGVSFTALAKTSKISGKKSLPLRINLQHEWTKSDYLFPEQTVAAVLEGKLGTATNKIAKIFVISDADIAISLENSRQGLLDNHLFIANIIDWLSDATGLATLKQKGITQEIKEPEVQISTWTKYFNLLLPILIVGAVGLFFHYRRKLHIDKLRTTPL